MRKGLKMESSKENGSMIRGGTGRKLDGEKENEFEKRELEFAKFNNRVCFICGKEFDFNKDWDEEFKNYKIVEQRNIPGYVHKKCRGLLNKNFIERSKMIDRELL